MTIKTVILKNGAEEALQLVHVAMVSLKKLINDEPIVFYELVMCCRDRNHVPFGNTAEKLQARALFPIHDSIRNVVLSSVVGDGLDMALGNPYQ